MVWKKCCGPTRQQVLQLMMTRLELKLAQTHVALTGPTRQQVLQLMMTKNNDECLLLKQKWRMLQTDLKGDLKEESDLSSRYWFTLFGSRYLDW